MMKKKVAMNKNLLFYRVVSILLCVIAVGIIIPIIIASRYSFYIADDFHNAVHDGVDGNNLMELFVQSINYAIGVFHSWQGTWFSSFLLGFLSPLNGYGTVQLCIVMIANAIAIIMSVGIFVYVICKEIHLKKEDTLIIIAFCTIGIFGYTSWFEIFYWFTGAMVYGLPMALGLFGIAFALKIKKTGGVFFSAVLVFMACGGSIAISGVVCFILLSIYIFLYTTDDKKKRQVGIIFCVAFFGALLNAIAPGNYIRHGVLDDTGVHIGKAIIIAFQEVFVIIKGLIGNPVFSLMVVSMVIVGINISTYKAIENGKVLLITVLLSMIAPLSATFPLCLGYSTNAWIPNRCKFIETIIVIFSIVTIALIAGSFIGKKFCDAKWENRISGLVNLLITIIIISLYHKSMSYEMWVNVTKGEYKNYYEDINEMYMGIKDDTNKDVFIYERPQEVPGFAIVELSEDMSFWVNLGIAQYYSKESVQYVSTPLFVNDNGGKIVRISDNIFKNKTGYVSIYKYDEIMQNKENIVMFGSFQKNYIIDCKDGQGKIIVELFEDSKGKKKIEEQVVEY